jgi:hypothetical protein
MAKWIIMLIERAIWINYIACVKQTLPDVKLIPPEGKLIQFKTEVIPYWSSYPLNPDTTLTLFQNLEQKARKSIDVEDDPSKLKITSYDISIGLKIFKIKL